MFHFSYQCALVCIVINISEKSDLKWINSVIAMDVNKQQKALEKISYVSSVRCAGTIKH